MTLGTVDMLPFYELRNKQLCNKYNQYKKQKIFRLGLITNNERKTDFCSTCKKKNTRIDKGVLCSRCCSPIHRKCCNLKHSKKNCSICSILLTLSLRQTILFLGIF